jgi:hypothetical protein
MRSPEPGRHTRAGAPPQNPHQRWDGESIIEAAVADQDSKKRPTVGSSFGCAAAGDSGSAARDPGGNGAGSPGK